jgi:AcrR family transcriptional regulator
MQTVEIKDAILEAAQRRFADYGYGKVTMAEIAADCSMSVGNLYRHFKSKSAIATACVTRFHQARLKSGIEISKQKKTFQQELETFLLGHLHFSYTQVSEYRHFCDLVEMIEALHPDILLDTEQRLIQWISKILQKGMDTGQVRKGDAQRLAYLIHQSLMRYNNLSSLKKNRLKVMEKDLSETIALFYSGLSEKEDSSFIVYQK